MALAFTKETDWVSGPKRHWVGKIAFDSSYPTGGEAVTAANFGLQVLEALFVEARDGYTFVWDKTNAKIKAHWVDTTVDGAAQAEVADTTSLATVSARAMAIGY